MVFRRLKMSRRVFRGIEMFMFLFLIVVNLKFIRFNIKGPPISTTKRQDIHNRTTTIISSAAATDSTEPGADDASSRHGAFRKASVQEEAILRTKNDQLSQTKQLSSMMLDAKVQLQTLKRPGFADVKRMDLYFAPDNMKLGKKRASKAFTVFGIPTVDRKNAYYLLGTLSSLVSQLTAAEKEEIVIVIFIHDQQTYVNKVIKDVKADFAHEVEIGMIQVVTPNLGFYPNKFDKLPRTYGDSVHRVAWRSKQSLDYAYLYYYCKDMGEYFVQLEDDIRAVDGYIEKMKSFIRINSHKKWSVLEFGSIGFIGMAYRGEHLESLAKFVRFFYWIMPVDWLFRYYNDIYLYQSTKRFAIKPSIFKHVGKFSSLAGQTRKVERNHKESSSDTFHVLGRRRYQKGPNPEAVISTTIKAHHGINKILNPYLGDGTVFWGKNPNQNDSIIIEFKEPHSISRIVIASGSVKYPHDRFYGTELYLSKKKRPNKNLPCEGFEMVDSFDRSLIDHVFQPAPAEGVRCLKIILTKLHRKCWLIVEEIAVLTNTST